MKEIWKPVPYKPYESKYSISNLGRVRPTIISKYSKNKAEFLTPVPSPRGYLFVSLYANGKQYSGFLHRMVALAFHGEPPKGKPYALHKNDRQTDNRASNLYWGAESDNWRDRQKNGIDLKGERNGRAKLSEDDVKAIRQLYAKGNISQQEIANRYNVHQTRISHIISRKHWAHID